jgi:glycosyltransferase involved in cell wall biosynthesis
MKLSIIMPVYNEANTVLEALRQVQSEPHKKEIIIVDDASCDGTRQLLESLKDENIKVLFNDKNRGKGYCIRKAIAEVTGDIAIIQDADLEYYADEYSILIEKIIEGKAEVVYGTRFMGTHRAFHFHHFLANQALNFIANILLNAYVTDMMTCYKAFTKEAIKSLRLEANRFGIEPEITAEVFKRNYRVYEVPISYDGRTYAEGKKIKWQDFFRCIYWLLRATLRRTKSKPRT